MKTCGYLGCDSHAEDLLFGIELCSNHRAIMHSELRYQYFTSKVAEMYHSGRLEVHTTGLTYIIELPNGNIKIGYSRDSDTLYKRFTSFHRDLGGSETKRVKILAVIDGGETMEALLHDKFNHLRLRNVFMEQFSNSSEILLYAKKLGVNESGLQAGLKYSNYTPKARLG